ncbi:SAM-dependent methyltransferase [Rhizoctonia solani]|uniref:Protein arginine methyltransferase NDUFAF7 n=1 Tax=Rhizoctonia solani TaxID=456999 RepID=A0A8H8SU82_9AGAM|nr:SAM-dependent methyltransferase [Rhizoctonia solani]QRW16843.1 SAM-dependent methyltransferase [Rhizoctonia solani]
MICLRGVSGSRSLLASSRRHLPTFRTFSQSCVSSKTSDPNSRDRWNYNESSLFDVEDPSALPHQTFRRVTASQLAKQAKEPPRRVKMLSRDFIDDALYNPHYGYFPKQATIFTPETPFDFAEIPNSRVFHQAVAERYRDYRLEAGVGTGPGRQVWHTPTELFKPYYGHAIARCLISEYLLKYFPYEDLVIYEIGAGNGTLAENILDFLQIEHPEVYERTRYRIIEISGSLAEKQTDRLQRRHAGIVEVLHKSVFDWTEQEPAPCFFLAMEVIDNFAHDIIRYEYETLRPLQAIVAINQLGDFFELYEPAHDPLISRFLNLRSRIRHNSPALAPSLANNSFMRAIRPYLPFAPNMTQREFIPTKLLEFLVLIHEKFPRHRLLLSDFSSLPDTIPGYNAPVVQTRVNDMMIPCETYLVHQGYFDIFFPTNFDLLRDMYESVVGGGDDERGTRASPLGSVAGSIKLGSNFFSPQGRRKPIEGVLSSSGLAVGERKSNVYAHREFLEKYADLDATTLRNGENPMLDFYQNVKFLF